MRCFFESLNGASLSVFCCCFVLLIQYLFLKTFLQKEQIFTNNKKSKLKFAKRKFPMPHLGYRSFNIKKLRQMNFKPSKFLQVAKLIFEKY